MTEPSCLADCTPLSGCTDAECTTFREFVVVRQRPPQKPAEPGRRVPPGALRLPDYDRLDHSPALRARVAAVPRPRLAPKYGSVDHAIEQAIDAAVAFYAALHATATTAVWAVGVDYEQCWDSRGYVRGNLVRSIPLTPGEQLEIEVKTWDRRTDRRQRVEAVELNLSSELTGDEKWMLASKMAFTNDINASANPSSGIRGGVSLPLKEIKADAGSQAELNGELSDALHHSTENTTEYVHDEVLKVAQALKSSRTNTVETVREAGTEATSKQVIANTNRCRSLTYHYFDVLQEFVVTTQRTGVDLYLLVPLPVPAITPEWVACHACYLRKVLPCETYYAGVDAAATLLQYQQMAALSLAAAAARRRRHSTRRWTRCSRTTRRFAARP
jgi:hypothetical protein